MSSSLISSYFKAKVSVSYRSPENFQHQKYIIRLDASDNFMIALGLKLSHGMHCLAQYCATFEPNGAINLLARITKSKIDKI